MTYAAFMNFTGECLLSRPTAERASGGGGAPLMSKHYEIQCRTWMISADGKTVPLDWAAICFRPYLAAAKREQQNHFCMTRIVRVHPDGRREIVT